MRTLKQIFIISVSIWPGVILSYSQDRHFAWSYESTTLPKGAIDIEPWFTFSAGRSRFYQEYASRLEFEFGLTDKLQTAFYFNSTTRAFAGIDSAGSVTGLIKESGISLSNEWKINLFDPSVKPVGLGLYGEYTLSPGELEFEWKLLLDKRMNGHIIAFNHVEEYEIEFEFSKMDSDPGSISSHMELKIENNLAYMYMVRPKLGFGLEVRNFNVIDHRDWEFSTLQAGPSFFYSLSAPGGNNSYWIIFNAFPQITNLGGEAPRGELYLNEVERFSGRVLLGLSF